MEAAKITAELEMVNEELTNQIFDLEMAVRRLQKELEAVKNQPVVAEEDVDVQEMTPYQRFLQAKAKSSSSRRFGNDNGRKWVYDTKTETWYDGLHFAGVTINKEEGLGVPMKIWDELRGREVSNSKVWYEVLRMFPTRFIKLEEMTPDMVSELADKPRRTH